MNLKFLSHFASGAWLFAEYAPEGMNPWVYSMTYNGAFLAADLAIVVVVMCIFYGIINGTSKK